MRSFSWSENEDVSTDQKLIESTVIEWYDAKHREISTEEIDFINSISIQCCPLCKSKHIVKNGHRKMEFKGIYVKIVNQDLLH